MKSSSKKIQEIAIGGMAIAAVATLTMMVAIPIGPGFINPSDAVIIMFALVYGPKIGGISGIGAAIADIALGYTFYAPFTLVTKVFTGVFVGIFRKSKVGAMIAIGISMFVMIFVYFIADLLFGEGFAQVHIYGNMVQALFTMGIGAVVIFGTSLIRPARKYTL